MVNKKSQSFGFDVLLSLTALLLFNQLLILNSPDNEKLILLEHRIENNQLLYLSLIYNNSLSLFDSYVCNGNIESLNKFTTNIQHVLDTYVTNREYLFLAGDEIISSEGVESVCLEKASPSVFEIETSCGTNIRFEFSIYTQGEKRPC